MFLKTTLLASGAFLAFAAPALAQTTTDSTDVEGVVVTGSYTINERIDTATGLGLSLLETPQSVTVVTAQRILDQNLQTVADVVTAAAGVSANEVDDVRNTFNARGFEINNYQIDGVPTAWTLAGGAGETAADVSIYERVEIVRGATGLLTGAGDPGASINLVRKHADSADFTGYVTAGVGSWNNYQISADVGGALTANGAVRGRAVAKYQTGESYIDLYKNEKAVIYGVVDADLGPNTLLRVGASHQQGAPNAPAWGALPSFFTDGSVTNWSRSKTASAKWSYWDTTNQNIFANLSHEFANGWRLKVNYNWLRNAQKTKLLYLSGLIDNATGTWRSESDPTVTSYSYPYKDEGESIQNSIDVQLQGDYSLFGRSHEFVVGALHSKQTLETTTFAANAYPDAGNFYTWDGTLADPGFSSVGYKAVDEETKQTGFYASTRFNVSDRLKVIAGGRLSSWERNGLNWGATLNYGDDNVFIPYAGALYDLAPNHRIYASYTEIFQPQNYRDITGAYLDPVTGESAEIGLKSSYFGGRLQSSVAIFRIVQDNLGQMDPDSTHNVPNVTPTTRAYFQTEGATSKGFELEVIGRPLDDWNVSFSYSMFEAEDADGAKVNTDHPRQLLKLFTTYRLPGAWEGLTLGGGVNWMSKAYTASTNPVTGGAYSFEQKAYALVSLMARYEINDALSVQANVENLTDETYYSQVGFYSQYRYGAPRNYTVSLKYAF
ncbi:TonB-dependent siderophore receptor [Caulobacter sp. D4A]|uniref:TonB-dependent siderophore receptor n=1 Tax=unclassified Caulobacter TaxID=2648921 RepID=UPI000D72CBC0|nr:MULTISPECIES: TonB-dependent siderophore receptor [unclassified Caulobacter]PXA84072.1 TonB-dependent siderophore receptor [Caulobacter sp. D4A]PXA89977.1 TonB-dependent siderophore receptor [Caulobacter sp. D5]